MSGCAALLVGCSDDGGPINGDQGDITFAWDDTECPNLAPAGSLANTANNDEAVVIIEGYDDLFADGLTLNEVFDCGDGDTPILSIPDGNWQFVGAIVDDWEGTTDPNFEFDCFDSANHDCLFYSDQVALADVDPLFSPQVDEVFDFLPSYAAIEANWTVEGQAPDSVQCDTASEFELFTILDTTADVGITENWLCDDNTPVDSLEEYGISISRDLPLGTYDVEASLVDDLGVEVSDPGASDPIGLAGEVDLDVHLDDALIVPVLIVAALKLIPPEVIADCRAKTIQRQDARP
jgi:hypothetical protein